MSWSVANLHNTTLAVGFPLWYALDLIHQENVGRNVSEQRIAMFAGAD